MVASPRRGPLPGGIVREGKDLLDVRGLLRAGRCKTVDRFSDAVEPWIVNPAATVDAVEDGGQVEQLAAGVEEVAIERLGCDQRGQRHGVPPAAKSRFVSRLTNWLRLPDRKPSRSSVTYRKPNSRSRSITASRQPG